MSSPAQVASEPTPQSAYLAQVVSTIIEFALRCGLPPQQLQALVTEQLTRGSGSAVSHTAVGNSLYVVTPNVLLRWHSDLSLLDAEGNPKPLRLHGAAPSVEALVLEESPREPAREVIVSMQESGMLRRASNGRYLPTTSAATVSQLNPLLVEHVTTSLVRFLETVHANVTAESSDGALLERSAQVINLPVSELPAFRGFVRDYGADFLTSVDNWLTQRSSQRAGRKATPVLGVGVHVFAHIQPEAKKPARARLARR